MKRKNHLAHLLNDDLSPSEIEAFKQDPDFELYQKIKHHTDDLQSPLGENPQLLTDVLAAKKKPKVVSMKAKTAWLSIAASLLIAVGLGYWFSMGTDTIHRTGFAQTQNLTLPDGSTVTLNSDAELRYEKSDWKSKRTLELKGEALFKVAKGKTFSVITPTGTVKVVGTQFNVRSRGKKLEVACYEGMVSVTRDETQIILLPGNAVLHDSKNWIRQKIESSAPDWMNAKISLQAASLNEVLAEIERTYDIKITAKSSPEKAFTGILPANDLAVALRIVESAFQLQTVKISNREYELKSL
ncbi:MAG: DUF4974 domain-containing protein [Flavobacterium sp.]|uniref:FecR family protein n=1 Tax=Flavobacterium sp. TaxID=239 RepID=UPI0012260ACA|nr:FecR domain-containing protein [Flavobacterium sp.]RZJ67176.1 MAG: DUF4974 domain-containing protein [Flavobacterium sp.]